MTLTGKIAFRRIAFTKSVAESQQTSSRAVVLAVQILSVPSVYESCGGSGEGQGTGWVEFELLPLLAIRWTSRAYRDERPRL